MSHARWPAALGAFALLASVGTPNANAQQIKTVFVIAMENDFNHTIAEIVISFRAHANVNGLPYASAVNYTHSSDLRTMQEIFHVGPLLGDAVNANDRSDLFKPGAVPKKP